MKPVLMTNSIYRVYHDQLGLDTPIWDLAQALDIDIELITQYIVNLADTLIGHMDNRLHVQRALFEQFFKNTDPPQHVGEYARLSALLAHVADHLLSLVPNGTAEITHVFSDHPAGLIYIKVRRSVRK